VNGSSVSCELLLVFALLLLYCRVLLYLLLYVGVSHMWCVLVMELVMIFCGCSYMMLFHSFWSKKVVISLLLARLVPRNWGIQDSNVLMAGCWVMQVWRWELCTLHPHSRTATHSSWPK
jgi:hypothetical protein